MKTKEAVIQGFTGTTTGKKSGRLLSIYTVNDYYTAYDTERGVVVDCQCADRVKRGRGAGRACKHMLALTAYLKPASKRVSVSFGGKTIESFSVQEAIDRSTASITLETRATRLVEILASQLPTPAPKSATLNERIESATLYGRNQGFSLMKSA